MKLDGKREKPPERIEMGGMGTISITRLFKFHSHPPISTLHLGGLISHFISAISWWIQACDAPLYTKNGINLVSRNNFPAPGFTLSGFWLRGCWFAFACIDQKIKTKRLPEKENINSMVFSSLFLPSRSS